MRGIAGRAGAQECLSGKDLKNGRYLDKRQLYVAQLGRLLEQHAAVSARYRVQYAAFHDDPVKLLLCLVPLPAAAASCSSSSLSLRLLVTISPAHFPLAKLLPSCCNLSQHSTRPLVRAASCRQRDSRAAAQVRAGRRATTSCCSRTRSWRSTRTCSPACSALPPPSATPSSCSRCVFAAPPA